MMGYRRRQKDLERKAKNRNPFAKSLSNAKYRQRVIPNKKKHNTLELDITTVLKDYE